MFIKSNSNSVKLVRKSLIRYIKGSTSALKDLKLARLEGLKSKVNPTFLLIYNTF